MGIYDREYYRDESGGGGWFSGVAPATRSIIAIYVAVFVLMLLGTAGPEDPPFIRALNASSVEIFRHYQFWRLLTGPFIPSGSLITFAFSMLILYFVGREMELIYGSREFAYTYTFAAVISTLFWAIFDFFGPGHGQGQLLNGSSGAVTAMLLLFALYYPNREILVFFVLPVRVWVILAVYIGFDLYQLLVSLQLAKAGDPTPTYYFADLAGAAYGWAYKSWDFRWTRLIRFDWFRRPRFRVVRPEPLERSRAARTPAMTGGAKPSGAPLISEEQLDARLDEVLAKIAREGRGSLTDDEQRVLQEASRRARNRRSERLS
jgi:membrane associated rhomboid family serine protease